MYGKGYIPNTEVIKEKENTLYVFNGKTDSNQKPDTNATSYQDMKLPGSKNGVWNFFVRDWRRYLVVLAPIALLWLPLMSGTSEARCGYVILLMAIYYVAEALPLAVTALMPVFAFPLLGIISTNAICMIYMKGTAMMFLGGLAVAIAVEHCNLHKRLALFVILKVGQSPRSLTGSFIFITMFLSMWISNTATTAMMVPILDSILQELYMNSSIAKNINIIENLEQETKFSSLHTSQMELVETDGASLNGNAIGSENKEQPKLPAKAIVTKMSAVANEKRLPPPDAESEALSNMCFLAIAYGSNLGGTGFPTGTGANIILWGILQSSFPGGTGLDFATWMAFNVPGMLIGVFVTWIWLDILFMGFWKWKKVASSSKEKGAAIRRLVQKHYDQLGDITFHEITVLVMFSILVFLWVFMAPEFITGWAELVQGAFSNSVKIGNATPAILITFLLFVLPSKNPWKNESKEPIPACLTWDVVHRKMPWGILIIMGGGFAIGEGAAKSGLSTWIKVQLQGLQVLPGQVIVFLICLITTFLTEIISNITTASILLPVLKEMALGIGMHPLYLMLPATVCCSYAFMLPIANPPNLVAFNASTMKSSDMMKAGFILNFLCVLIMTGLINTLGVALFDLHTFPEWAGGVGGDIGPLNSTLKIELLLNYSSTVAPYS